MINVINVDQTFRDFLEEIMDKPSVDGASHDARLVAAAILTLADMAKEMDDTLERLIRAVDNIPS